MVLNRKCLSMLAAFVCLCLCSVGAARADVIDFESLSPGIQPGNVLAGSGVIFTTGTIPDLVAIGDTFTLGSPSTQFFIFEGANAISGMRAAVAFGEGGDDLLIFFTAPVTSVSVKSDDGVEAADVIRLLALQPTGSPNEFTVLAFDQKLDDAVSAPGNLLSISLGGTPFSYALFQTTTEPEGFDDLTFTPHQPTPEPTTMLLLGTGLAGVGAAARKRRKSQRKEQF